MVSGFLRIQLKRPTLIGAISRSILFALLGDGSLSSSQTVTDFDPVPFLCPALLSLLYFQVDFFLVLASTGTSHSFQYDIFLCLV